jgi:hypothetical protein
MHKQFKFALLPGVILSTLALTACGGGSSSGSNQGEGTTDILARGEITAATDDSISVNGVEWETPESGTYSDDDDTVGVVFGSDDVGKVVTFKGTRNDDGVSGTVTEVEYEAEVEGTADADGKINNVSFIIDDKTNISLAPSITANALAENQRYEVSGFWINDTKIHATFVKHDDDDDAVDEIKGVVDAVDATSITVNGVVYLYNDANLSFSVGNIVEIHFNPKSNPLEATSVELEDDLLSGAEDGQEIEIEGSVNLTAQDLTDLCPAGSNTLFLINSTCIDYSAVPTSGWLDGLTGFDDLVSGLRVEAEGHFNAAGVLIAEKIKGRGNQVRAEAIATNITGSTDGTLMLFASSVSPIEITFQSGVTEIEINDDTDLTNATDGDGLEIRGIRTGDSSVLALRIRDKSVKEDSQELRAEVNNDGADETTNTISVMGITALLGSNTELEEEETTLAPGNGFTTEAQIDSFLVSIDDDGIVSVGNGPNDIVEIRIDTTSNDGSQATPYEAEQVEIEHEDD